MRIRELRAWKLFYFSNTTFQMFFFLEQKTCNVTHWNIIWSHTTTTGFESGIQTRLSYWWRCYCRRCVQGPCICITPSLVGVCSIYRQTKKILLLCILSPSEIVEGNHILFGSHLSSQNNCFFTVDKHCNSSVYACMHVEVCLFPANTHGAKQQIPFCWLKWLNWGW
jgi:hypothetical protein